MDDKRFLQTLIREASPVHLAIWRESQNTQGAMMTYTDTVRKLIDSLLVLLYVSCMVIRLFQIASN